MPDAVDSRLFCPTFHNKKHVRAFLLVGWLIDIRKGKKVNQKNRPHVLFFRSHPQTLGFSQIALQLARPPRISPE
jgi:hypothetical protein